MYPVQRQRFPDRASLISSREGLGDFSINDSETLEPIDRIEDSPALLSLAAFVGQTRLIDNIVLGKTKKQDAAGANG